jgi:hypothetical protein
MNAFEKGFVPSLSQLPNTSGIFICGPTWQILILQTHLKHSHPTLQLFLIVSACLEHSRPTLLGFKDSRPTRWGLQDSRPTRLGLEDSCLARLGLEDSRLARLLPEDSRPPLLGLKHSHPISRFDTMNRSFTVLAILSL